MPLGISKEENLPELLSSPPLLPSSLSVLSVILFLRLSPNPPQQTAQSSSALTHHLFLLQSILRALPTGQTGNSDLTFRTQGMTLGSMCAATIRTNRTYRHLLPGTGRRLLSELGLSTNNDALLPGIHPNRTLSSQNIKKGSALSIWMVMHGYSPLFPDMCKINASIPFFKMFQFQYDVKACGRLSNRDRLHPFFLLKMYSMHLTFNYIAFHKELNSMPFRFIRHILMKITMAMTGSFNRLFRSDVKWTCTSPFTLAADVPLQITSVLPSNWPPPISGAVPVPSFQPCIQAASCDKRLPSRQTSLRRVTSSTAN